MRDEDLKELLNDRLEGWELAEMLDLTVQDIYTEFRDKIEEYLEELKDILEINDDEDEETE